VARAALMRKESRGAHTRLDYEGERDDWLKVNVVIRRGNDGEMQVEQVQRPDPVPYLKEIANAKIEDLEAGKVGASAPND
jgi:succinate dehydrogenase / fumarate reductase flavoprotein subunit